MPLSDLIKKDQNYEFGPIVKQAFQKLKEEFRVNRVLAAYNPERQGIIETDISDIAIGAIYN